MRQHRAFALNSSRTLVNMQRSAVFFALLHGKQRLCSRVASHFAFSTHPNERSYPPSLILRSIHIGSGAPAAKSRIDSSIKISLSNWVALGRP
jgi:hypothetical protein